MQKKRQPPSKDRRDVGQVVFLSEKVATARELSSCCVGVEASLETNSGFAGLLRRLASGAGRPGSDRD